MAKIQNPSGLVLKVMRRLAGIQKGLGSGATIVNAGVAMTPAQIAARLEAMLASHQAVDDARKALATALAARDAQVPADRKFLSTLDLGLKAQFGPEDPRLLDFGVKPQKPPPQKTAVEKALAAKKGQDTKAAKGTGRGKKQLAAITLAGSPGLQAVEADGTPGAMLKPPVAPARLPGGAADGSGNAEGIGTPSGK